MICYECLNLDEKMYGRKSRMHKMDKMPKHSSKLLLVTVYWFLKFSANLVAVAS